MTRNRRLIFLLLGAAMSGLSVLLCGVKSGVYVDIALALSVYTSVVFIGLAVIPWGSE